jgi:hypothetical protein
MTLGRRTKSAPEADDERIAQLVVEVLDQFLAPAARNAVLEQSLDECGLDAIPSEIRRARLFVYGPLASTLRARVGEDVRDAVIEALEPMFAMMTTESSEEESIPPAQYGVPRSLASDPSPRPTPPLRLTVSAPANAADPAPSELRPTRPPPGDSRRTDSAQTIPASAPETSVLFATKDGTAVVELSHWLGEKARIEQVGHVVELIGLELPGGIAPIVVIDRAHPTVELASVLALRDDWPPGTQFLVFRPRPGDDSVRAAAELGAMIGDTIEWLVSAILARLDRRPR